ncbi:hypothetical protein C8R45DRAFT_850757, partial [Mycena sanguinolenta]
TVMGRKRPSRVLGATTSASGALIPEAIRKKFSGPDGWKTHVPLHFLTDKYCSISNHASTEELNDLFSIDGSSGTVISVAKELPADPELELTFDQWFQAFGRLLELIKTYVPEEHPLWVVHFECMLYATNRSEEWSLWLEYDSQVRSRALNEVFDPSVFQTQIWTQLQAKHIKNSVVTLLGPLSKSGGRKAGRSGSGNDNRGEHPYNVSDRPPRDRDTSNSFRTYSRCFFCGSSEPGHTSRVCTSRQIVNGKPVILIFKKQGANRKDRDGEAYCYSFSGRNGCSGGGNCNKGKHWCSLCGNKSGVHSAQDCASI